VAAAPRAQARRHRPHRGSGARAASWRGCPAARGARSLAEATPERPRHCRPRPGRPADCHEHGRFAGHSRVWSARENHHTFPLIKCPTPGESSYAADGSIVQSANQTIVDKPGTQRRPHEKGGGEVAVAGHRRQAARARGTGTAPGLVRASHRRRDPGHSGKLVHRGGDLPRSARVSTDQAVVRAVSRTSSAYWECQWVFRRRSVDLGARRASVMVAGSPSHAREAAQGRQGDLRPASGPGIRSGRQR
jgi:hypothetical protein